MTSPEHADGLFPEMPAGATITGFRPLPSDPSTRSVLVNGRVVTRLGEAEIDQLELEVGQAWDDDLASSVAWIVNQRKARTEMMRLLSRRNLSRGEVLARLTEKGHAADVADTVVRVAVEDGWVDDGAIADGIIERATAKKPASADFLREKLAARHISGRDADAAIERAMADGDPLRDAMDLARRELDRHEPGDAARTVRRVSSVLARRGFDDDVVSTVIDRLGIAPPEAFD